MSLSDPIADMLTRIRNGLRARQQTINVRASKTCEGVCRVLKEEGYLADYKRIEDGKQGLLRVYLKYGPQGEEVITEIRRVSKPGRRVYVGKGDIPWVLSGMGISILTTSRGIMTGQQARRQGVGGEVLCYVW